VGAASTAVWLGETVAASNASSSATIDMAARVRTTGTTSAADEGELDTSGSIVGAIVVTAVVGIAELLVGLLSLSAASDAGEAVGLKPCSSASDNGVLAVAVASESVPKDDEESAGLAAAVSGESVGETSGTSGSLSLAAGVEAANPAAAMRARAACAAAAGDCFSPVINEAADADGAKPAPGRWPGRGADVGVSNELADFIPAGPVEAAVGAAAADAGVEGVPKDLPRAKFAVEADAANVGVPLTPAAFGVAAVVAAAAGEGAGDGYGDAAEGEAGGGEVKDKVERCPGFGVDAAVVPLPMLARAAMSSTMDMSCRHPNESRGRKHGHDSRHDN
jgi:hypothetical protein